MSLEPRHYSKCNLIILCIQTAPSDFINLLKYLLCWMKWNMYLVVVRWKIFQMNHFLYSNNSKLLSQNFYNSMIKLIFADICVQIFSANKVILPLCFYWEVGQLCLLYASNIVSVIVYSTVLIPSENTFNNNMNKNLLHLKEDTYINLSKISFAQLKTY